MEESRHGASGLYDFIKKAVGETHADEFYNAITEQGCESIEDLLHLKKKHLQSLKPIPVKKLLAAIKKIASSDDFSSVPLTDDDFSFLVRDYTQWTRVEVFQFVHTLWDDQGYANMFYEAHMSGSSIDGITENTFVHLKIPMGLLMKLRNSTFLHLTIEQYKSLQEFFKKIEIEEKKGFKCCIANNLNSGDAIRILPKDDFAKFFHPDANSVDLFKKEEENLEMCRVLGTKIDFKGVNPFDPNLYKDVYKLFSYKSMAFRDGITSAAISLPTDTLAGLQRALTTSFSPILASSGTMVLQAHDVGIGLGVLVFQGAVNLYRWLKGDITGKQAWKNMASNAMTVVGSAAGVAAGVATGVAIGSAVGVVAGPVGIVAGGILGAFIGGLIFGGLGRVIVEKLFPDGDLEEFLSKRRAMLEALENLGCNEGSTDEELREAYKRGLLLYHPDRNPGRVYDQDFKNKFLTHVLSYECVSTYRKDLQNSIKILNFQPSQDANVNVTALKKLKPIKSKEYEKAYDTLLYHYKNQGPKNCFRTAFDWLDGKPIKKDDTPLLELENGKHD